MAIVALLIIVGVPAFIAYLVALFANKKMVKAGNINARRNGVLIFIGSFVILVASILMFLAYNLSFER